jgi:hypothetical protein
VLIGLKDVNGHYWVMSVPILAVIAAAGIDKIGRLAEKMDVQGSWHLRIAIACILLLLMPCMGNMVLSPMNLSRKLYGENPFAESACVAQRLAAITTLNDRVYIAGSEPQILVYAQRKSATRFIIAYPLTFPTPRTQNTTKSF